ncbi:MAG: ABC transporter substrate-binding protein [Bdellovibrionota bacterium]|nr:ABC transporter substrate-binding protein [Bdellovibrionota bacterium]
MNLKITKKKFTALILLFLLPLASMAASKKSKGPAVNLGALLALTGPIEGMVPPILDSVKMAADEINKNGGLLGGRELKLTVGDSKCSAEGGADAAKKLVNINKVSGIVGALCSGASTAAASGVAVPAGVVMISPASTAPTLTTLKDNDLFYRVIPSDAYQGIYLANLVLKKGIKKVSMTFVNNDYGVGLAKSFRDNYKKAGGQIVAESKHEDKKASYRSELATLRKGGPEALVLIAYSEGSGQTIMRQALENKFFNRFVGADGMISEKLVKRIGVKQLKSSFFSRPVASKTRAATKWEKNFGQFSKHKLKSIFAREAYDAAMILALAIQKGGSDDRATVKANIRAVSKAPGEIIEPGEWKKAVELIAAGKDINYNGAAGDHELDKNGDVPGVFGEFVVQMGNSFKQVK